MRRAAAVLALLAAGCLPRAPSPTTTEGRWAEERDRWTRSKKLYDRLDDIAFATATYQSLPVRLARVDRLAVWKGMTAEERAALEGQERADAAQFEDFFLDFYTFDRRANDLDLPGSTWRVALRVGDGQVLPSAISLVPAEPTVAVLYPYVGNFDTLYRVRFPAWRGERPLAETTFRLEISGALGRIDLDFAPPKSGG